MKHASLLAVALMLSGCAKYIPVELQGIPVPKECKKNHAWDLPAVPPMEGPKVSPDAINKHWARHYRLKARSRYRNLRRDYQICSQYAKN